MYEKVGPISTALDGRDWNKQSVKDFKIEGLQSKSDDLKNELAHVQDTNVQLTNQLSQFQGTTDQLTIMQKRIQTLETENDSLKKGTQAEGAARVELASRFEKSIAEERKEKQVLIAEAEKLREEKKDAQRVVDKLAEETARAHAEKVRADTEKARADTEKDRADTEKVRADTEKNRANTEKDRADAEKVRADSEKVRADSEKAYVVVLNISGRAWGRGNSVHPPPNSLHSSLLSPQNSLYFLKQCPL